MRDVAEIYLLVTMASLLCFFIAAAIGGEDRYPGNTYATIAGFLCVMGAILALVALGLFMTFGIRAL